MFPFLILYFKQLGLTTTECSVIFGVMPILSAVSRITFGAVADKFQIHRQMTLTFCLLTPALICCLLLVAPVDKQRNNVVLVDTQSYCTGHPTGSVLTCTVDTMGYDVVSNGSAAEVLRYCTVQNSTTQTYFQDCSSLDKLNKSVANNLTDDNGGIVSEYTSDYCQLNCSAAERSPVNTNEYQTFGRTFWALLFTLASANLFYGPVWALTYGMVYAVLGENRNKFGQQRMWGTVASVMASICTAFALNKYGASRADTDYTPCFVACAIWFTIAGITALFFKLPHISRNPAMAKDLWQLLKQPQICLVFIVLFIMGCMYGALDTFLLMYLKGMGATSWVLGACLFAQYIAEIPALYFCGRIIKRIGHVGCIYLVLITYSIRFLGTSLIPSPWWEIPFSMLRSVGFSIGFTAVSVYSSLIAPPSMHATLQATVQVTHYGLGETLKHSDLVQNLLFCN